MPWLSERSVFNPLSPIPPEADLRFWGEGKGFGTPQTPVRLRRTPLSSHSRGACPRGNGEQESSEDSTGCWASPSSTSWPANPHRSPFAKGGLQGVQVAGHPLKPHWGRVSAFSYSPVAMVTRLPSARRKVRLPSGPIDWASPSSTDLPDLMRTVLPSVSTWGSH